jgi:hypothetical protein
MTNMIIMYTGVYVVYCICTAYLILYNIRTTASTLLIELDELTLCAMPLLDEGHTASEKVQNHIHACTLLVS